MQNRYKFQCLEIETILLEKPNTRIIGDMLEKIEYTGVMFDSMDNSCMDMDNSSGICPEAKICPYSYHHC